MYWWFNIFNPIVEKETKNGKPCKRNNFTDMETDMEVFKVREKRLENF